MPLSPQCLTASFRSDPAEQKRLSQLREVGGESDFFSSRRHLLTSTIFRSLYPSSSGLFTSGSIKVAHAYAESYQGVGGER
jgi:hypothetical protein